MDADTMGATPFEYRFRYALHGLIYVLGFTAPWTYVTPFFGTQDDLWRVAPPFLERAHLLSFQTASYLLLAFAILFSALGTFLRVWGSAYVGATIVHSPSMHGEAMLADGPYRRTRNPLYLGTFLHTLAVALIMPVSGAVFTVVLIGLLQVRLALAEEPFLTARFGQAYRDYAARVPRFVPSLRPRVPAADTRPHWLQACVGEVYMLGVALVFLVFGWMFNQHILLQGILVSLGLSMIVRALLPRPRVVTT